MNRAFRNRNKRRLTHQARNVARRRRKVENFMQKGCFPASLFPWAPLGYCQEPRCSKRATVKCYIPFLRRPENYCAAHAIENGYCCGCGHFWAGISSFDFSKSGLCENCLSEMQNDEDADDYERFAVHGCDSDSPDDSLDDE